MKKFISILIVAVLAISCVFAGDFDFIVGTIDVNNDVLFGFCPTYAEIGVGYNGLEFINGNKTQLRAMVGGGYLKDYLYQNEDGSPVEWESKDDVVDINTWHIIGDLQLNQGFGISDVEGFDLVTAYAGYKLDWERFINFQGPAAIYPNLVGPNAVTNSFYLGAKLNMLDDRMVSTDGCTAEIRFDYAPAFINEKSDYYSMTASTVFGRTVYELQQGNGKNLFSIVFMDRINASFTDGTQVPLYAQLPVSLGNKIRGLEKGTYNTNLTLVNNMEVRFASPEPWFDGIFARVNLFLDAGYYAGRYFNAPKDSVRDSGFVASMGGQLEICLFDFIDLGIQGSYLLKGKNFREPGNKFVFDVIFTLDY